MAKTKIDKRTKEYKEFIKQHPQGLGDVIDNITTKTGIKKVVELFSELTGIDCGCDERLEELNKDYPVRYKANRCFTEDEYDWYKNYYDNRTLALVTEEQLKEVLSLHESIFLWKVNNLCHNCSGSANIIRGMIERLDKVYLSYENNI